MMQGDRDGIILSLMAAQRIVPPVPWGEVFVGTSVRLSKLKLFIVVLTTSLYSINSSIATQRNMCILILDVI